MEKFSHFEGRESQVQIHNQTPIGGGMRGDVFRVDAEVGNRTRNFVLKKFVDFQIHKPKETITETASQSAEAAFLNHALAKEAGLRTFTTYRMGEDKESILMTDAKVEGKICIGSNSHGATLETLGYEKLKEIKNFDTLLENCFEEVVKAARHDLVLWGDALFFIIDESSGDVDYIVGDYDSLSYGAENKTLAGAFLTARALIQFVTENVNEPGEYIAKIESYFKEFKRGLSKNG